MKHIFLTILILTIFLTGALQAQTANTVKLLGLSVEGNEYTDQGLIKANSSLLVGRDITGEDIQEAIRQLWKLELFSDIRIVLDRQVEDGVYLTIEVEEYPRLETVQVKGNDKVKRDKIMDAVDLLPGQVLRPNQVMRVE
mgnify:FL=1